MRDAYAFSGLMNQYRYQEKTGFLTQLNDNWQKQSSGMSNALTILSCLGVVAELSPQGALLIEAISLVLEAIKPKQFEKAADVMGSFTKDISDNMGNYEIQDIQCSLYVRSTTTESNYPNAPTKGKTTKTLTRVNFYAHLVDKNNPDNVLFISKVLEVEE